MGLGKTATAIVAVETHLRHERNLVVCPKSLKAWWQQEIERWGKLPVRMNEFWPVNFTGGWLIAHWEQVRMYPDEFSKVPWTWIVADEAHRIKNRKTQTFRAFKHLHSPYMILITGTPFSNHPGELWALLNVLHPEQHRSYWAFFDMFTKSWNSPWGPKPVGVKNVKLLVKELGPVMLRRRKEDVLKELPPKRHKYEFIAMKPQQEKVYRQMAELFWCEFMDGVEWTAPNVISRITRLQQILCSTALLSNEDHSAKLDRLMEIIADSDDEPLVVFSRFRRTVELIKQRCDDAGVSCRTLLGGMQPEEVGARVMDFQRGKFRILPCTLATGGVGLTLTKAHTAIFIDRHWNPAIQTQAEDRLHRGGQDHPVLIIYLHTPRTVDDTVARVCKIKESMTARVWAAHLRSELLFWREDD